MNPHFTWETGRILGNYQILLIRSGRGQLETECTDPIKLEQGMAVFLCPNIWHRFRPDYEVGWSEAWIEMRGPVLDHLRLAGLFAAETPCVRLIDPVSIETIFNRIHESLRVAGNRPDPLTGAWAIEILARLEGDRSTAGPPRPINLAVARAEKMMAENESPPHLDRLAKELGFAYSHFRREFRLITGYSPGQYSKRIRMEKVRTLLNETSESLQSISDRLGFSSPYHLSSAFKKFFGVPPSHWRRGDRAAPALNADQLNTGL